MAKYLLDLVAYFLTYIYKRKVWIVEKKFRKTLFSAFLLCVFFCVMPFSAMAEGNITSIRTLGTRVYFVITSNLPCSTTVYRIDDTSTEADKALYTTLLTAYAGQMTIAPEVSTCEGWGTAVGGILMQRD